MKKILISFLSVFVVTLSFSQSKEQVINAIMNEAFQNSELEQNGFELLDMIGPRLVGTPEMRKAHDWLLDKYKSYGISAELEEWGKWKGWERGITHIDMVYPRVKTMAGTQLAWSPSTKKKGVEAEVVNLPKVSNKAEFDEWLKTIKGKFVTVAMLQPTGRPDYDWEKWATKESFEKMKKEREELVKEWNDNLLNTGYVAGTRGISAKKELIEVIEEAGAVGIIDSYWSKAFGTNKIFGALTKEIPMVDLELEDYSTLYRMVEKGEKPRLNIVALSKELGTVPTFNTIGRIEGVEKPDEFVILSAHFDSWDGGTGATDNGTGTLLMLEVMRVLKKVYPNPKRTILVGHWESEEQGLNGSAAFVEDHPELLDKIQVVFNQDNGTGRVEKIYGSGFLHSYNYISRWLEAVPDTVSSISTFFPGEPARGGTDHASFVRAGVPAFNLSSLSWNYGPYTWHTNRDTYDKIVWSEVRNNVVLTAVLAFMASEDDVKVSNEKIIQPINKSTGEPKSWPSKISPNRNGGL